MVKTIPERKVSKNSKTKRLNKFDNGQVMERHIENSPLCKIEATMFKCKHCELKFSARNIAEIVRCGKICNPCRKIVGSPGYMRENEQNKIVVPEYKINALYTCKRCGAGYKESTTKCLLCDCVEFLTKK